MSRIKLYRDPQSKKIFFLGLTGEDGVYDTVTVARVDVRSPDQVSVHEVKGSDEELVRVLLLVARQVVGVGPRHVEQNVWYQRRLGSAVELLLKRN